ncbi:unnamed protein product [Cunninghamella blakesleeana]
MLLSVFSAQLKTIRSYSTHVQSPKQSIGLGNLADNPGAVSQRTRVGRGPGSGKGKTAARGHKGQNADLVMVSLLLGLKVVNFH